MLALIGWSLLSLAVFVAATWVYVILQALVGRAAGIDVERVAVGYFPVARWKGRHWEWVVGALPISGYTKFRWDESEVPVHVVEEGILKGVKVIDTDIAEEEIEQRRRWLLDHPSPGAFLAAPLSARLLILASGPLSNLLLGSLLLAAAVGLAAPQLELCPPAETQVTPCAVGGLRTAATPVTESASTWAGQFALVREIASGAASRFLLFQSLDGWGGWVGTMVTAGAAARGSLANWLTCLGAMLWVMGAFNLLPLGTCNGGQMINAVAGDLVGQARYENVFQRFAMTSFGYLLVVSVRVLYADAAWLWSLWAGLPAA